MLITFFISDSNVFTDVEIGEYGLTRGYIVNGGWWFPTGMSLNGAKSPPKYYANIDELYIFRTVNIGDCHKLLEHIHSSRDKFVKFTDLEESDRKLVIEQSKLESRIESRDEYIKYSQDDLRKILEYKFKEFKYSRTRLIEYMIKGASSSSGAGNAKEMTLKYIDSRPHYYEYWDGDVTVVFMDRVYSDELNKSIPIRMPK